MLRRGAGGCGLAARSCRRRTIWRFSPRGVCGTQQPRQFRRSRGLIEGGPHVRRARKEWRCAWAEDGGQ
eukprot:10848107-Lingulodinium_polyedra.AAC.1